MRQPTSRRHSNAIAGDIRPAADVRLPDLLQKIPAAAYTCDAAGLITCYNSHAENLWGRAPRLNHEDDRFCGSFALSSTAGEPIAHDECWMALALRERREYHGCEIIIGRQDGSSMHALAYASPLLDDDGELEGAVNVLVDITDQRKLQSELREADRRKEEFLAVLSHELRNPLAPIRNIVDTLLEKPPGAQAADPRLLQVLDRQVGNLTRLVDDLLEISRINSGTMELRQQSTNLESVVEAAVEFATPRIEAGGHTLVVRLPDSPVQLVADPLRLAQAIGNLLLNSARYTPPRGRIELDATLAEGRLRIVVRDNGVGISPDMLSRIFDPFTCGTADTGNGGEGLGLGLMITRRLISLHGGDIEVDSGGPGLGSEFRILLPHRTDHGTSVADISDSASGADATEHLAPAPGVMQTVLIVDDNRDAADLLKLGLTARGFSATAVYGGAEACAAVAADPPQVVLLDIGMPGMDGYEVARRLRAAHGGPVRLIALTGWGQERDRTRTMDAGFDDHLTKPVRFDELAAILTRKSAGPRPSRAH